MGYLIKTENKLSVDNIINGQKNKRYKNYNGWIDDKLLELKNNQYSIYADDITPKDHHDIDRFIGNRLSRPKFCWRI